MGKILTLDEANKQAQKPWMADIKQEVGNAVQLVVAHNKLELDMLKIDIMLNAGNYDGAFVTLFYVGQNPTATPAILIEIINTLHEIKDKLSDDFVDKNTELVESMKKILESVKTAPGFNKKKCNEILNKLNGV